MKVQVAEDISYSLQMHLSEVGIKAKWPVLLAFAADLRR